jgi:Flp pilus assembly protein TadD
MSKGIFYRLSALHSRISSIHQKRFVHALIIAVLGLVIYSNTFEVPFHWDDNLYIVDNTIIKDLCNFGEPSSISGHNLYVSVMDRYISYLSFALNYRFHGLDVRGYHAFNLAVHLINSLLVYFLVLHTFRAPLLENSLLKENSKHLAFFTGLFFVSHPVQTEAVTYIFQRHASLVTLFYLVSLVSYIRWRLGGNFILYPVSFLSAVLAMKTKENAFTLPFIVLIYEFIFMKGPLRGRALRLFPILLTLLVVPFSIITLGLPDWMPVADWTDMGKDVYSRGYLLTQFSVVMKYIGLLFLPVNQNLDYDYPMYTSFYNPNVLAPFAALVLLVFFGLYLLYRSRRRSPDYGLIAFGIFWFMIALSVESGLVPISMLIDEYRVYLPSVGFFMAVSCSAFYIACLLKGRTPFISRHLTTGLTVVVIVFSVSTYLRNNVWRTEISLWEDTVAKSPNKARPHNNLGLAYERRGQHERAMKAYEAAIRADPNYAEAHVNLGLIYYRQHRYDEAVKEYQAAIRNNNNLSKAHSYLGMVYERMWDFKAAEREYELALLADPYDVGAHYHLGVVYEIEGDENKAEREFLTVIRIDQHNAGAHNNLGYIYLNRGVYEEAEKEFRTALRIKPEYIEAHNNLGVLYELEGKIAEAEEELKDAIELDPSSVEAHNNLGVVYELEGRYNKAEEELKRAVMLRPDYADAHNNLGVVYELEGKYAEAEEELKRAVMMRPDYAEAHNNLGVLYELEGRYAEAEEEFKTVIMLNPHNAEAHNNLGVVYEDECKYAEAEEILKRAVMLRPDYAEAHNNLGVLYELEGKYAEAEREFKNAITLRPFDAEAHNNLGVVYDLEGRHAEAEREFKNAITLRPFDAEAHNNLGVHYEMGGEYKDAEKELITAVTLRPGYADAHDNLRVVYDLEGEYDKAGEELNIATMLRARYAGTNKSPGAEIETGNRCERGKSEIQTEVRTYNNESRFIINLQISTGIVKEIAL